MRTEIIEILQKAYPEYCLKHIDTANEILRLFSVSNSVCKCTCSNSLEYSNCNKNCERVEAERQTDC